MNSTVSADYWAKAPYERSQLLLFSPSLDDAVPAGHAVRELDAILESLDWGEFEKGYDGVRGQPPIHPRHMAAAILYGIICGVSSSRRLEEATRVRIDFMWLLQGMTIDHSTVAKFRTRFETALKALFRQVNRKALQQMGSALAELVVDGTRVRANSDRHGARTAGWLERRLEELQRYMEEALQQMGTADLRENLGAAAPEALQAHIEVLRQQVERCEKALAVARERDEAKREKDGQGATPVRVPVTDTDAQLLPNKEGGYAPNYTPVAGVDGASGLILAAVVLADGSEAASVQPMVEAVQQDHEVSLQRILFDSGFASGANLAAMAEQGVEVYAPVDSPSGENHPAQREDPSQPLPPERLATLPRVKSNGKLDRNAFLYDPQLDLYWCPMGRRLPPHRTLSRKTADGAVEYTEYQSLDCEHCPLAAGCLSKKAKRRSINRDQFEDRREETARRMGTDEAKAIYRRRAPTIEGTFGCIKSAMGFRRFLLRGLDKVRLEWLWVCTAFNLKKLLRFLAGHSPDRPGRPIPAPACVPRAGSGLTALCLSASRHPLELLLGPVRSAGSFRAPPWRQAA
jgi:transposase